jgi:hypothetical protein
MKSSRSIELNKNQVLGNIVTNSLTSFFLQVLYLPCKQMSFVGTGRHIFKKKKPNSEEDGFYKLMSAF